MKPSTRSTSPAGTRRERIETVPLSDWFTIPPGGVSHVAWQVGHLAMAEYRLCLAPAAPPHGRRTSRCSRRLVPEAVRPRSIPGPVTDYPPPSEIRAAFDRVHARVMEELPSYPDADLDLPR